MTLIAWVVKKGGPLLVAVFQPLLLVMVALAGSLLLDEKLHLGRYDISIIFLVVDLLPWRL